MKAPTDVYGTSIEEEDTVRVVNSSLVSYGMDGKVKLVDNDGSVLVDFNSNANAHSYVVDISTIRYKNTNSLSVQEKHNEQNKQNTNKTKSGFSSTMVEDNTDKFGENPVMVTLGTESVFLKDYSDESLYTVVYVAESDKKKFKDITVGTIIEEDELLDLGFSPNYIPFRGKIMLEQ